MTPSSARKSKLKTLFWTVLMFNLAEYAAIIFFLVSIWKLLVVADNGFAGTLSLMLLVVLPGLLLYQAMFVLNNYFPARKFSITFRVFLLVLCITQILSSIFLIVLDLNTIFVDLPRETNTGTNDIPVLPAYLIVIALFLASMANITAAVVLWRTVGTIRRNYRNEPWDSFAAD